MQVNLCNGHRIVVIIVILWHFFVLLYVASLTIGDQNSGSVINKASGGEAHHVSFAGDFNHWAKSLCVSSFHLWAIAVKSVNAVCWSCRYIFILLRKVLF